MDIYLTQENHKSLCEFFDLQYKPIEFETIRIQPTKYMRGNLHPMYGFKFSEETKHLMSSIRKGIIFSEETKRKLREAGRKNKNFLGRTHSEEAKKKMSESAKNRTDKKKLRCSCIICGKEISNNHIGIHYKIHT